MIVNVFSSRFGRRVTVRRDPGITAPLNLCEIEVYESKYGKKALGSNL